MHIHYMKVTRYLKILSCSEVMGNVFVKDISGIFRNSFAWILLTAPQLGPVGSFSGKFSAMILQM